MNVACVRTFIDWKLLETYIQTMPRLYHFNSAERQLQKQHSREADDQALRSGAVSRDQLSGENGFFSSLDIRRGSVSRRGRVHA